MKSPRVESSTLPVALVSLVARIALVAAVALATAGCHMMRVPTPKAVNWYIGDAKDVSVVRRIMLLPFQQAAGVEGGDDDRAAHGATGTARRCESRHVQSIGAGVARLVQTD